MPRTNSALELRPSFLTAGSRWLLFLLVLSAAMGPVQAALQRQATLTATVPNTYNFKYLLYLPPGYDPNGTTQWPLMIFLHGAGERGTNPDVVAVNGPPMLIEKGRDFPAIVISPQCSDSWWDYTALELFIEDRVRQYRVDPDRVYVTGLSMGGYAVWDLAVNHPGNYAAAAPLCGAGTPSLGYRARNLPLWAFHGALDATVPVYRTQEMINAIRLAGGNPLVTIYPDLGHDVWTVTYANEELYTWLFAQRRVPAAPVIDVAPRSAATEIGQIPTFTVMVTGAPTPTLQWQRLPAGSTTWENLGEGGSYRGVNSPSLSASPISSAMSGDQFRCVITNSLGSVTTNPVSLTITNLASAIFQYPAGIALDNTGRLIVADTYTNTIRAVTPTGSVSILAGAEGVAGTTDGSALNARFNQPGGVAVDAAGNLYVTDTGNSTIRKITASGTVSTLAGSSVNRGGADGSGSAATFNSPAGIVVDGAGTLYVADTLNATIRRITTAGDVTTLAGKATVRGEADGPGTSARFNSPNGLALDSAGSLYVADTYNDTIRKISPTGAVTTLAGSAGIMGTTDLTGSYALFNQPVGLAADAAGNILVADSANATIRRIAPDGSVTTLAGLAGIAGMGDGPGAGALFNQPRGLTLDNSGNIFVADTGNAAIRKITPNRTVSTLSLSKAAATSSGSDTTTTGGGTTTSSGGSTTGTSGSSTSSGGGGGAMGEWLPGALALLIVARRLRHLRGRATASRPGSARVIPS